MYTMSRYKDNIRFHEQYGEIHNFLQAVADGGCNEHFHWVEARSVGHFVSKYRC